MHYSRWQLPAARVGLGTPYAQVRGDAHLVWRENAWDLSLDARAEPVGFVLKKSEAAIERLQKPAPMERLKIFG